MQNGNWYPESKVYNDGGHYIAIPHTKRQLKKRRKRREKVFVISNDGQKESVEEEKNKEELEDENEEITAVQENLFEAIDKKPKMQVKAEKITIERVTRESEFTRLYDSSEGLKGEERKEKIVNGILRLFPNREAAEIYVERKFENKKRAIIARRVRFFRKAYMNDFNYFATFTYDDAKHTEESFRKKLMKCLQNFHTKYDWKYMGVWERGAKTQRLHFHGLVYVPPNTMPGNMDEVKSYDFHNHRIQTTQQNSFFRNRFGLNDFANMNKTDPEYKNSLAYILKYVEKTGEKIVYSRGLPMYLISDIHNSDVVANVGIEEKKLLLFDDFTCWDCGELIGKISDEAKERLRKANN